MGTPKKKPSSLAKLPPALRERAEAREVKVRATKPGQPSVFDVIGLDAAGLKSLLGT